MFKQSPLPTSLLTLLALVFCLICTTTRAHQQKQAYTSILFNDRNHHIEVSHRFYLHDAEHAIADILGSPADLVADKESQQRFANYIQKQFRLLNQHQQMLALGEVGFEVEGKFFWVYQEIAQPEDLTAIYISMRALQDVWPGQINQVNVEYTNVPTQGAKVRSVRLTSDDDWQRIDIER
ncbi:hypothetical protein QWY77_03070 [Thalassotalea ponticola]|uniref:DUF6702 family protein n=1 Tax=Thalassotalea ponticola TaxID=1523392 RepID=UPI0025B420C9|nr:DUF6702 family protein [Thalassotalea ponticola]MDN3651746.1 hypothetical protein [Thalassotalea ponticola]